MSNVRNFSHTSNFLFTGTLFGEETTYKLQSINLPGVSFSHPQLAGSSVLGWAQGDTAVYNAVNMSFIMDENLELWKEIHRYLVKMRDPETSFGELNEKQGYLEIHDDNSNLVLKLRFVNMVIESISDLDFSTIQEDEIMTLEVTALYDYYVIEED